MILLLTAFLNAQRPDEVREPEVAGMFYPGTAQDLSGMTTCF